MKICPICGKEFEPAHNNQKYCCPKCQKEAIRLLAKERRLKKKPKNKRKSKPWQHCNRTDCLYYNDSKTPINYCDYNWLTGQLKSCKGGAECTKYKHSTAEERKRYRNSVLKKDEEGRNMSIFRFYLR